jgi:hypothetical protein
MRGDRTWSLGADSVKIKSGQNRRAPSLCCTRCAGTTGGGVRWQRACRGRVILSDIPSIDHQGTEGRCTRPWTVTLP